MDWLTFRDPDESRTARDGLPSVTELSPELLIGEYIRPEDVEWLKQTHGVTAVFNLQDDEDLKVKGLDLAALEAAYGRHAMVAVRVPVPDASDEQLALRLESALSQLRRLIDSGRRVYLHCNAGVNRAPTVAIAFIHAHRMMPLGEAVAYVKSRRVCAPFDRMLEEFFAARAARPRD